MRIMFASLLLCYLMTLASAAEITGTVKNYATGQGLDSATVQIPELKLETLTNAEGVFHVELPAGSFVIRVFRERFRTYSYIQPVAATDTRLAFAIELKPKEAGETTAAYAAEQPRYQMEEVTVTTTRASTNHPVTYTNLPRQEVAERNYGQDLPLLLTEMPNVSAYSDGANGVGYSYLRMRGFGQNRVAVQINGTPLNDAGTHEVFWIDLPDFAQDVQDIQVQRGVGSSLYGPAAFGGTINIVTKTPGLGTRPMLRAEGTYGSWNTRRASVLFESGRIEDRYGITGRLTRMHTDGYRFGSWANLWSYYLSAARFTGAHTTRLVFYGGPEKTHLAYEGVTKDYLNGRITGNKDNDRRFNPITYKGEIDNFFQPHYELHDQWKLAGDLRFDNSLYLFRGDGYYDQYRADQNVHKYFFAATVPDTSITVLRRRNVGETDGGWIPRLTLDHRYGETTLGGEVRLHQAHHEGQIVWSDWTAAGIGPDYNYYDYQIRRQSYSAYVHNLITVTKSLRAMADVTAQRTDFEMRNDALWGVSFGKAYSALSPRLGLTYQLTQPGGRAPLGLVYTNLSWAQREPTYKDIYDPQTADFLPPNDPGSFLAVPGGYKYVGPASQPEKLMNFEAGTQWQWVKARVGVNYYYMRIRDELVPYGTINDLGVAITVNAEQTLHQGLEFVAAWEPLRGLDLSGNLALTDHHFVRYNEWDWNLNDGNGGYANRNGNRLAADPATIANLRVGYSRRGFSGALSWRAQGQQYIDNTENENTVVPAYSLLNLDLGYRFAGLSGTAQAVELRLRINNLLNTEYETFGFYSDQYAPNFWDPEYIVGAPRAVYATLAVEL